MLPNFPRARQSDGPPQSSFLFLADGHHIDEAGNLISCTYVDFRNPAERTPTTTLRKASSKRYAVPGCGTIRLSQPSRFRDRGKGRAIDPARRERVFGASGDPDLVDGPRPVRGSRNAWIYSTSIEPQTREELATWRAAMPTYYDAVSPIRRPREFARALGAMLAEQTGPQGPKVVLRHTIGSSTFDTMHRSQEVYHGPVVYEDDPYDRLAHASSDLELQLLRVFMKSPTHRGQREYRFAVWTEEEPDEDWMDLQVSPALIEAVRRPRPEAAGGFAPSLVEERSSVEGVDSPEASRVKLHVEALPAFVEGSNAAIGPYRYVVEQLPNYVQEPTPLCAIVKTLRASVAGAGAACRQESAAAAHAESVVQFLRSMFGDGIADVKVSEDGILLISAEFFRDDRVEATIAVGPEGTCACKMTVGEVGVAATAPDARSLEMALREKLSEVGVSGRLEVPVT